MKLSEADKREIIRLNKEEGVSQKRLAIMFNIGVRRIEDLINKYNLHGEEVLVKGPNRKCSPEFKMEIIDQYINGQSKESLSIANNIRISMIDSWIRRYDEGGYNGLVDKKKGRPPKMKKRDDDLIHKTLNKNDDDAIAAESADKAKIKLLEKKNKELEAEVAYLKNRMP